MHPFVEEISLMIVGVNAPSSSGDSQPPGMNTKSWLYGMRPLSHVEPNAGDDQKGKRLEIPEPTTIFVVAMTFT